MLYSCRGGGIHLQKLSKLEKSVGHCCHQKFKGGSYFINACTLSLGKSYPCSVSRIKTYTGELHLSSSHVPSKHAKNVNLQIKRIAKPDGHIPIHVQRSASYL